MSLIPTILRARPGARGARTLGVPRAIALLGTFGAAALSSIPASASDGVLEINQTCAVQTGCFAGDTAGLPVTISASGSYRLTSNLVVSNENTDGIQVSTDNVSIDLSGFEIRGPGVCSGLPILCVPGAGTGSGVERTTFVLSGISVRNGSVRGMGSVGVLLGRQSEVTNVRARSNRLEGIIVDAGSTVTGNTAYQNGSDGIFAGFSSTISGNSSFQNGGNGINTNLGSTASGNSVNQNEDSGIFAGVGATVSNNTAYGNAGSGIQSSSGASISGNTVRANGGFGLNLASQSGYRENVISGNGGGTVSGASAVNLGNNACNGSTVCP